MEKLDFLIIGAGPSGMYFAKKCQEFKKKYKLIEKKKVIGGQPMALYPDKIVYDYPNTKEIISRQIIKKLRKGIKQIYINQSVKKIVFKNGKFDVFLTKEQKILADKIVIATGLGSFSFNPLMIKEAKGKENIIYSVKNVRMFRNKSVIVLGGGDSAVDWANQLTKIAAAVTLVHRREELRASQSDISLLKKNNVELLLNWTPDRLIVNDTLSIRNNLTGSLRQIPYDYIIVQYGFKIEGAIPSFLRGIKVTSNNKIIVDKNQQTNITNIFAIGDCCFYDNKENTMASGINEADKILSKNISKK